MEQQEIRSKFPVFSQNKRLVYLDNAATSQKPEGVIDRVRQFYLSENSNIHRGIILSAAGRQNAMITQSKRSAIGLTHVRRRKLYIQKAVQRQLISWLPEWMV